MLCRSCADTLRDDLKGRPFGKASIENVNSHNTYILHLQLSNGKIDQMHAKAHYCPSCGKRVSL